MHGEIDLELYTISIIRLNNALAKLQDSKSIDEVKIAFEESEKDLKKLYEEITDDLNQDEINLNEYYPFFEYVKLNFPKYIEILKSLENKELNENIISLIGVFSKFYRLSENFLTNEMIKWNMI